MANQEENKQNQLPTAETLGIDSNILQGEAVGDQYLKEKVERFKRGANSLGKTSGVEGISRFGRGQHYGQGNKRTTVSSLKNLDYAFKSRDSYRDEERGGWLRANKMDKS
tara:strand:+ start:258 stop:587 length:330 start_codon:yes stop_codon:yes gene_type:complete